MKIGDQNFDSVYRIRKSSLLLLDSFSVEALALTISLVFAELA